MADLRVDLKGNAEKGLRDLAGSAKDAEKGSAALLAEVTKLSSAMQTLKENAIEAAAEGLREFVRSIPEGLVNAERHQQALGALGAAYGEVQRATLGSVSAEQAWQAQQRVAQAGIQLTAQELAAVTQRAREYARTTGTDLNQALEQLADQLVDPGEELRKFGITLQSGLTRTEGIRSALAQLTQQVSATARPTLTAAEAQEQFNRSLGRATDEVGAFLARAVGLTEFFAQTATYLDEITDGTRSWTEALGDAVQGTVTEALGGRSTTSRTAGQAGNFASAYNQSVDALRRAGVDTRAYPMAGQLSTLSREEQQRVLEIVQGDLRRSQEQQRLTGGSRNAPRAGAALFGTDIDEARRLPSIGGEIVAERGLGAAASSQEQITALGTQARTRAERERREREAAARAERERRERERRQQIERELAAMVAPVDSDAVRRARVDFEQAQLEAQAAGVGGALGALGRAATPEAVRQRRLDVLRRSATETDARRGENEVARLQRLTAATREYLTALQQYRQEDERLETQIRSSAQAEKDRLETIVEGLRTGQDATRRRMTDTLATADEELQTRRQMDAALDPSARGDTRRSQERMRDLLELRRAYQDLLEQTDQRLTQARAEGRDQGEINTLMQERLGLLRSLSGATQELTAIQREQNAATIAFKDSMVSALSGVADGFGAAAVAALDGEKSFGDAMAGMLREQAKALAKQAIIETLKNTALGFYNLGIGNVPGAVSNFKAAGLWAAVGLAAGVTVATTAPSGAGAAGGGAQGSTRSAGVERAARPEQGGGPLNLTIAISGAVFTDDGITEAVSRGVRRAAATGRLPTRILRE